MPVAANTISLFVMLSGLFVDRRMQCSEPIDDIVGVPGHSWNKNNDWLLIDIPELFGQIENKHITIASQQHRHQPQ